VKFTPPNTSRNYRYSIEDIKEYGIFMLDSHGRVSSWGKGARHHLGYTESEVVGKNFLMFFRNNNLVVRTTKNALKMAVAEGNYLYQEQCIRKNRKVFWGSIALTVIMDTLGKLQGFSVILRDTTDQVKTQNIRIHQSMHDYLTGLPNRRYLEETLKDSIHTIKKGMLLGVLFLDFNNFKRVNNSGHKYGDLILSAIAQRLQEHAREKDIVSRLGGDEFIIVFRDFKKIEDLKRIAENTLKLFRKPIKVGKKTFTITVSIGVAVYPKDGRTVNDLLHHSDMALYQAKKSGGNSYEFYSKS
jgi:diguanylate cyclase (GGDEF)-like protein/PAS domain S-box-containing protein